MKIKSVRRIAFATYAVVLIGGIVALMPLVAKQTVDPASFSGVGKTIKEKFSEYAAYSDVEIGSRLLEKGYIDEKQRAAMHSRGITDEQIDSFVRYVDTYPWWLKVLIFFGYMIGITAFYVLSLRVLRIAWHRRKAMQTQQNTVQAE